MLITLHYIGLLTANIISHLSFLVCFQQRLVTEKALVIITGSIASRAKCQYISYSEADFDVIRPAGATRCTDGGEIWHGGVGYGPLLHAKFYTRRCKNKGIRPSKLKFFVRIYENS